MLSVNGVVSFLTTKDDQTICKNFAMNLFIAIQPNSSFTKTQYIYFLGFVLQSVEGENHEKAVDLLKAAEGVETMSLQIITIF